MISRDEIIRQTAAAIPHPGDLLLSNCQTAQFFRGDKLQLSRQLSKDLGTIATSLFAMVGDSVNVVLYTISSTPVADSGKLFHEFGFVFISMTKI